MKKFHITQYVEHPLIIISTPCIHAIAFSTEPGNVLSLCHAWPILLYSYVLLMVKCGQIEMGKCESDRA